MTQAQRNLLFNPTFWDFFQGRITPRQLEQRLGRNMAAEAIRFSPPPGWRYNPTTQTVEFKPFWVRRTH